MPCFSNNATFPKTELLFFYNIKGQHPCIRLTEHVYAFLINPYMERMHNCGDVKINILDLSGYLKNCLITNLGNECRFIDGRSCLIYKNYAITVVENMDEGVFGVDIRNAVGEPIQGISENIIRVNDEEHIFCSFEKSLFENGDLISFYKEFLGYNILPNDNVTLGYIAERSERNTFSGKYTLAIKTSFDVYKLSENAQEIINRHLIENVEKYVSDDVVIINGIPDELQKMVRPSLRTYKESTFKKEFGDELRAFVRIDELEKYDHDKIPNFPRTGLIFIANNYDCCFYLKEKSESKKRKSSELYFSEPDHSNEESDSRKRTSH